MVPEDQPAQAGLQLPGHHTRGGKRAATGEGGYLTLSELAVTICWHRFFGFALAQECLCTLGRKAQFSARDQQTSMSSSSAGGGAEWLGP